MCASEIVIALRGVRLSDEYVQKEEGTDPRIPYNMYNKQLEGLMKAEISNNKNKNNNNET